MLKITIPFFLIILSFSFKKKDKANALPVIFKEYGVQINNIEKLGDTIYYQKSSVEKFKFVFYDNMGKCYCEYFLKDRVFQRGNYENSLDTLKRYVSGRTNHGVTTPIIVESFFAPLKNGIWITYKNNKEIKEEYVMGVMK